MLFALQFCAVVNLKLHQILEVKNIFKQENVMLPLKFNPGLTLTGFRTTRPWWSNFIRLELATGMNRFGNTAAILNSISSNSYYGMLRGQIQTNLPPEHPMIWNNRIQNGRCITEKVHCNHHNLIPFHNQVVQNLQRVLEFLSWQLCHTWNTLFEHLRKFLRKKVKMFHVK